MGYEKPAQHLIIGGDVFRNTYTSLKNPDFIPDTDMDPVKAKKTRHEILDLLTKEKRKRSRMNPEVCELSY